MLSKLEKKLMGVVKKKIRGNIFEIKKVTPADCLDKEGIPVSQWQAETNLFIQRRAESQQTIGEISKMRKRLFLKAIVSIDGQEDMLEKLIDSILHNLPLAADLETEIMAHSFGVKKKTMNIFTNIFQNNK